MALPGSDIEVQSESLYRQHSAPASNHDEQADRGSSQARSAAEDLVARRLRVLNKKLQRFRSYIGGSGLNDDQRAGIASIPGLEGATKELEEIGGSLKQLAVQEGKKEETRRLQEEAVSQRRIQAALEDYKTDRLPLLSSLLQVHGILRPVGAVETHFMASDLPESLQDLSRDDVVVFDSLHANLITGDIEDVLTRIRQLDANSNVRRALDSFIKLPLSQSSSPRQASIHSEHEDRPVSSRNAKEGCTDTADLTTSIAEEVIHLGIEVDQHTSDSLARGFGSVKYQPKVYSFIQSSELPALDNEEPNAGPDVTQTERRVEPTDDVKGQPDDQWHEPTKTKASDIERPGPDWTDDDDALPRELELEQIRAQFGPPAIEILATGSPSAQDGQETPGPLETESTIVETTRKDIHDVLNKSVEPKPILVETATNAGSSEATFSGPIQSRRKPFHRPRATARIAQPAGSSQPDTPAKPGAIDHDGFQIATKRREKVNNSVPGSPGPRRGVPRQEGTKTKGDSGRQQGRSVDKAVKARGAVV